MNPGVRLRKAIIALDDAMHYTRRTWFSLTRQERLAIGTVITIFLIGLATRLALQ